MRHRVKSTRLNRKSAELKALIRSLVTSVILYEDIETTKDKAKLARSIVDRVISKAKSKDKLSAIRYIQRHLLDKNASKKVIEELISRYKDRTSGFTRFVKTRVREGDGAELGRFQLV